ncbi:hypothetical protein LP420_40310 [Massilia sp. B-10]|nr:hypothetical protein LP420_40310 [Massilia sp. B-10]
MFNLFGGGTGFEDWLSGDNSYVWKKFAFKDKLPLLESEALAIDGGSGALGTPVFATDDAYGISYSREFDKDVDVVPGVTTVWNHNLAPGVAMAGPTPALPGEIILTQTDYNDTAIWTVNATVTDTTATYHSDFENRTIFAEEWQTGGGWLRTKTYHTQITEETGQKDYYTHAAAPTMRSASPSWAAPVRPSTSAARRICSSRVTSRSPTAARSPSIRPTNRCSAA